MKKLVICVVALFLPVLVNVAGGQTVSGVTASQEGKNIAVSYVLSDDAADVGLYVSTDGGRNFSGPLRCVSGDVGGVRAGSRRIVWDVLSEYEKFVGESIVFKVTAGPSGRDLSAFGTANCYIVSSRGDYKFKGTVKGNSAESVGSPVSAEVLWESFGTSTRPAAGDIVSNVSYSNGYVSFTSGADGNAVIAVKDASGTILWSWHIWVCEGYDPASKQQTYKHNAGTMMDRNLGATSATKGDVRSLGLLYQWGRKDPFLGSSSSSSNAEAASTLSWPSAVSSSSSTGTISYAVSHPATFITYNDSNYDWYYTGSSSTDKTRWQLSKTKYDPCPPGYRVPDGGSSGVWSTAFGTGSYWTTKSNWDSTNKGMDLGSTDRRLGSGTIWYPAAGYRSGGSGSLSTVGSLGYYWSCTPNSYDAYVLWFSRYGIVSPSGYSDRAYGRSVRCLSE